MNLNSYELVALFHVPYSLILWSIDFLSDKELVKDELEIGTIQYLHYLIVSFTIGILVLLLASKSMPITILTVIISMCSQIGFLINKDICWITRITNLKINPNMPNRKWRGDVESLIKHYIRGDSWAYSEIRNNDMSNTINYINLFTFFQLIKLVFLNKNKH
jgi:hypothetical protein